MKEKGALGFAVQWMNVTTLSSEMKPDRQAGNPRQGIPT